MIIGQLKKTNNSFGCQLVWLSTCLVVLLTGCGLRTVGGVSSDLSPLGEAKGAYRLVDLGVDDRRRFDYFFLEAVYQQECGNYTDAFELLNHCLSIDSCSAEVYYMLSSYYADMQRDSLTMECMKSAARLNPGNAFYLERFGQSLLNIGDYAGATDIYERLWRANRSRVDVLNVLLKIYQYEKDYAGMIGVLDRLELVDGFSEELTLNKMHVYSLQGRKVDELNELRRLTEKNPYDLNYRVMMGNWLLQNGRSDEALDVFRGVLDVEPDNLSAQLSLVDYYKSQGLDSLSNVLTERLLISRGTPVDTKLSLLRQFIMEDEESGGDSLRVLGLLDRILEGPQDGASMAEMKVAYMFLKKMPDADIRVALERVLSIEPENVSARIQLLQNIWKLEDYGEVVRLSQLGTEYNPDEMAFYYFLGLAYYQMDAHDAALDALRRGVSQINEKSNVEFVSDFYAIMGDILHEKGLNGEAFAAYDSCLVWKPNNLGALNNYAYYLSELGQDLEKAERMSFKTISEEPDNVVYLDTYAWILFMRGRYDEARVYIDKALVNDSTLDAIYFEHAGDIYAELGDVVKAVEFWKKALEKDGKNGLLRKKIRMRKYVAK